MANNQEASGKFRPYMADEFRPGQYIVSGNDTSSPWRNGIITMAQNHNTLIARFSHVHVNQVSTFDPISWSGGSVVFARYVVRIPSLPYRNTLTMNVRGVTSGGSTFEVRATTTAGNSSWSGATASGSTATVINIPVQLLGGYEMVSVEFRTNVASTFTPAEVFIVQTPITTTDIGEYVTAPYDASHMPIDLDQCADDQPLTVDMMQSMIRSGSRHFRNNTRAVVTWCVWRDYATVATDDYGLAVDYSSNRDNYVLLNDYIYYPRPGVTVLRVFMAARCDNYTGTSPYLLVKFLDTTSTVLGTAVSTDTTVFTEGGWLFWNKQVPIPQKEGPLFLGVYGKVLNDTPAPRMFVQALTVIEEVGGNV